ncbi:hypothetical protein [Streptomyces sp. NRRL S-350]|uniref:hypothetical protein n=1 Tax=Streptomyces sp. NRRL S-350 TaxID=1463902 RepID=UPI0004BE493D|nr:hypothetical protein [Streptomyces sp. NRRL S-350]
MAPPSPTMATVAEKLPSGFRLSDGRTLLTPRPVGQQEVSIGCWIRVDGWPCEVTNMLWRSGGGRILHLNAQGTTVVIPVQSFETVEKYTVLATPVRR